MTGASSKYYPFKLGMDYKYVSVSGSLAIISCAVWSISDSVLALIICILATFVFIAFGKPVLDGARVTFERGKIGYYRRFRKPLVFSAAKTIGQVIERKKSGLTTFRFKVGKIYVTITPYGYHDGEELQKRLVTHLSKKKVVFEYVTK